MEYRAAELQSNPNSYFAYVRDIGVMTGDLIARAPDMGEVLQAADGTLRQTAGSMPSDEIKLFYSEQGIEPTDWVVNWMKKRCEAITVGNARAGISGIAERTALQLRQPAPARPAVRYSDAVWRQAAYPDPSDPGQRLTLETVRLDGVREYGAAASFRIQQHNEKDWELITIDVYGDQNYAAFRQSGTHEEVQEWAAVRAAFRDDPGIRRITAGRFEDEKALDDTLKVLHDRYFSGRNTEGVWALFSGIRQRALKKRGLLWQRAAHQDFSPDIGTLRELHGKLQQIQVWHS